MEESTKKLIKERFKALPQDIKDAILSADLPHQILAISKENTLMLDQTATLETKIMLVMLALESVDDFVNNLQKIFKYR